MPLFSGIETAQIPRPGMLAVVRNRRGIVAAVEPYDGETGRLHLVHLDYKDDQYPIEERLVWEIERGQLLEPNELPDPSRSGPMPVDDFDALLRASRWTAASPFLDPDGDGPLQRLPISSPFHGAVQVDDFQLVPLLKALRMPRVNLMIADDVGLGKTVEAGLILTELLLRRRIQRVLILTPASLRSQWRDEMRDKFALPFDMIDRTETHALRRKLGMDANPWRSFSRIISSYHYLRQPDVLDQFLAACRTPDGSPHLPWDLLIVDECHNLMPSAYGDDSDLSRMLRLLAPQFEHRLFLSATPHNGHTRCFSGLLEILDPVRFSQTSELKPAEKERIQQVVLRRLKREINARTSPPKFCTRLPPKALVLQLSPAEVALSEAFDAFRAAIRKLIAQGGVSRRRAGSFAVEILGKRLLSCPTAFAESWRRCKGGLDEGEMATDTDIAVVRKSVERDTGDDRETQAREAAAASTVGAWLKNVATDLKEEMAAIDIALKGLRIDVAKEVTAQNPSADARFTTLVALIDTLLRKDGKWRADERLIVFTEYKTTLDYLNRRLTERYEPERFLSLFGGMDEIERDLVKQSFNDPAQPVRVLVATDAAAEGLNLQTTARYLIHFDCPWNPSRIEQRNGRIDRHGQGRDVTIHHFVSDQDQDLAFLSHVVSKVDEIREDLGSMNELFDEATHRRLVEGEDAVSVRAHLDKLVVAARGRATIDADATVATGDDGQAAGEQLRILAEALDLDAASMRDTLESALAIRAGRPQLECSEPARVCKLLNPGLAGWTDTIDESLRRPLNRTSRGPVMKLAFSPEPFLDDIGGRQVFSPRADLLLMHLSHPMLQRALSSLTRRRFPGTGDSVSRWAVRTGDVPKGSDALLLVSVEEIAVNDLRETFHHWVRTLAIPVRAGALQEPQPNRSAIQWRSGRTTTREEHIKRATEILDDVMPELKRVLSKHATSLSTALSHQLEAAGKEARKQEEERYRSRQGEVSSLIAENTLAKLEREIVNLKTDRAQGLLFDQAATFDAIDRSIEEKQAEVKRRTQHYEEVRGQLEKERERILKHLLPKRHAMTAPPQAFPVCIEVRLPEDAQ